MPSINWKTGSPPDIGKVYRVWYMSQVLHAKWTGEYWEDTASGMVLYGVTHWTDTTTG